MSLLGIRSACAGPCVAGYQTPFARRIRAKGGAKTAAVGMIADPAQADQIVRTGQADLVLLARELLRDAYWLLHAGALLGKQALWRRSILVPARKRR
jgi:2,4-dienoyl-CoA reductase-like NADH-dependent reductase (Old Yellow Enzyme family)